MNTDFAIAHRLVALRQSLGLTQTEVANRVTPGCTRQLVCAWETGLKIPSEASIQALAHALNTSPAYIRYGIGKAPE